MKNELLAKIVRLNNKCFPFFVVLSYFFLSVETFTYPGFVWKSIFINAKAFALVTIFSSMIFIFYKDKTKDKNKEYLGNLVINLNSLLLPILLMSFLLMAISENRHYNNYVFATFHLQPDVFFLLPIFSASLLIVGSIKRSFVPDLNTTFIKKNFWLFVTILVLTYGLIVNLTNVLVSGIKKTYMYLVTCRWIMIRK